MQISIVELILEIYENTPHMMALLSYVVYICGDSANKTLIADSNNQGNKQREAAFLKPWPRINCYAEM